MRIFLALSLPLLGTFVGGSQLRISSLEGPSPSRPKEDLNWNDSPLQNETGHLIFNSVYGLLRHWPNILYRNGHTIVPGTIAPGTLLYHGRTRAGSAPSGPEWASFDPEHSYMFGRVLHTYAVGDEPLRVLYFDGSSATKIGTGVIDTQEILLHGNVKKGRWKDEVNRIVDLCTWGKDFRIQGFIRMSVDFEVMLCSFEDGVRLVSTLDLLPASKENWGPKLQPQTWSVRRPSVAPSRKPGNHIPPGPWDEPGLPDGWRGSLLPAHSIHFEVIQAGNRHNSAPGVNGVALDYSKLVSFFDPKYKSLIQWREGVERTKWRVGEISKADVGLFQDELADALSKNEVDSGVKWDGVINSVVERHAGRLEFLSDWLGDHRENATQIVVHARRAVLTMLTPYLAISSIPSDYKTDTTWLNPAMHHCSTAFTSHLPVIRFTPQEHRLKHSVEIVTKEICRTLGVLWVDALDAEELDDEKEKRKIVDKWAAEIKKLMDWLGWAEWVKCKPACRKYEMCSLPQWPYDARWMDPEPEISHTPKCMSRIEQDPGGPEWLS